MGFQTDILKSLSDWLKITQSLSDWLRAPLSVSLKTLLSRCKKHTWFIGINFGISHKNYDSTGY